MVGIEQTLDFLMAVNNKITYQMHFPYITLQKHIIKKIASLYAFEEEQTQ